MFQPIFCCLLLKHVTSPFCAFTVETSTILVHSAAKKKHRDFKTNYNAISKLGYIYFIAISKRLHSLF